MSNLTKPHFLFDDFLTKDWFETQRSVKRTLGEPKVNILETKTEFTIQLAAPGLKKEDFRLDFKSGLLTVERVAKEPAENTQGHYTHQEFNYDAFQRRFTLPKHITKEDVQATYEQGILSVQILKKVPAKNEESQIEIQ